MMPLPAPSPRMPLPAAFQTALLCALFGANPVAIKISLAGLGIYTAAAIRFAVAAAAISLWAFATGRSFALRRDQVRQLALLAMIFIPQIGLFYVGISRTTAARGNLIVNLLPFFVMLLAHRFIPGERITARKLAGTLLGFIGLLSLFFEKAAPGRGFQPGDPLMLAAAFAWSCNAVYTKRIIDNFDPFQLVLYPMALSIPFFLLGGWLWDHPMATRLDGAILISMIYQSLIAAAFGFIAWTTLQQRYGASTLHAFVFIMPISGLLLGGLLLDEPLTANLLLATGLIVCGLIVVNGGPSRPNHGSP